MGANNAFAQAEGVEGMPNGEGNMLAETLACGRRGEVKWPKKVTGGRGEGKDLGPREVFAGVGRAAERSQECPVGEGRLTSSWVACEKAPVGPVAAVRVAGCFVIAVAKEEMAGVQGAEGGVEVMGEGSRLHQEPARTEGVRGSVLDEEEPVKAGGEGGVEGGRGGGDGTRGETIVGGSGGRGGDGGTYRKEGMRGEGVKGDEGQFCFVEVFNVFVGVGDLPAG